MVLSGFFDRYEMIVILFLFSLALGVILDWLYSAFFECSRRQATLGKIVLGLIVTDFHGNRISFGQASKRYFSKFISSILVIGYLMAAFTQNKQALHDLIAHTLVIQK